MGICLIMLTVLSSHFDCLLDADGVQLVLVVLLDVMLALELLFGLFEVGVVGRWDNFGNGGGCNKA